MSMDITKLWIQITGVIGVIGGIYTWVRVKIKKWAPLLSPMILEAEKRAQDGVIDRADRKAIVMEGIKALEANGTIKLNFITRLIISKIVDVIAGRLPDFKLNNKPS